MAATLDSGPSTWRAHYTLAILYLVSLVSYIDRQVIALLAPAIQRDLALADWQLGFVTGTSFAILYVAMSIPLSYLADRRNRTRLLAGCLVAWSAMTALCGAAASFVQLALARVGVAVGEAGAYPASISMIGDLYPAEKRATVTAIFFSAVPAGTLVSLYGGGIVAEAVGWRLTFLIAALPGVALAVILLATVREPRRGAQEKGAYVAASSSLTIWGAVRAQYETLAALVKDPAYRWIAIAAAVGNIELFAIVVWSPTYAIRAFDLDMSEVGKGLGLATGLISALVMIGAGVVADRIQRRAPSAPVFIAAAGHGLCIVFLTAALNSDDFFWFCVFAAGAYGGSAAAGPMTIAATQSRVLPAVRAIAAALLVMIATLAGYGLGPPLIGLTSDLVEGDPAERLRTALLAGLAMTAVAALILCHAGRAFSRDIRSSTPA